MSFRYRKRRTFEDLVAVHLSRGNRYNSIRDDGKRVPMGIIACQDQRCWLPADQEATHSFDKVTCHACLKIMLREFLEKASFCKWALENTPNKKPTGFRFPKLIRGKREARFEIDPEIMQRLGVEL